MLPHTTDARQLGKPAAPRRGQMRAGEERGTEASAAYGRKPRRGNEADGRVSAARRLGNRDEGVSDRTKIVLDVRAGAAVGCPLTAPTVISRLDVSAIENDLDVVGLGKRLAQVPVEVRAIARHHEDLEVHGPRLYHELRP
jgi:hypothetical protein